MTSSPVQPLSLTPSAASVITTCSTDAVDHHISQSVLTSGNEAAIPGEVLIRKGRFWVKTTPAAIIHHVAHSHIKAGAVTHSPPVDSIADGRSTSSTTTTPKLDEQISNPKGTPSTSYALKQSSNNSHNHHHQHHRDNSHYRSIATGDIVSPTRPASAPLTSSPFKSINLDEQILHPSIEQQQQQPSFYSFLTSSKKHDEAGNLHHSRLKHHDRSSKQHPLQKRNFSQVSSPLPSLSPQMHMNKDHKEIHHVRIYEDDHSEHGSKASSKKKIVQTKANELDDMLSKMKDYMNSIVSDYELLRNQYQNKTTEVCS